MSFFSPLQQLNQLVAIYGPGAKTAGISSKYSLQDVEDEKVLLSATEACVFCFWALHELQ